MRKFTAFIVTVLMLFALTACSGGASSNGTKPYESTTASDISEKQLQEFIEQAKSQRAQS